MALLPEAFAAQSFARATSFEASLPRTMASASSRPASSNLASAIWIGVSMEYMRSADLESYSAAVRPYPDVETPELEL